MKEGENRSAWTKPLMTSLKMPYTKATKFNPQPKLEPPLQPALVADVCKESRHAKHYTTRRLVIYFAWWQSHSTTVLKVPQQLGELTTLNGHGKYTTPHQKPMFNIVWLSTIKSHWITYNQNNNSMSLRCTEEANTQSLHIGFPLESKHIAY